jgi:hypothetical protein
VPVRLSGQSTPSCLGRRESPLSSKADADRLKSASGLSPRCRRSVRRVSNIPCCQDGCGRAQPLARRRSAGRCIDQQRRRRRRGCADCCRPAASKRYRRLLCRAAAADCLPWRGPAVIDAEADDRGPRLPAASRVCTQRCSVTPTRQLHRHLAGPGPDQPRLPPRTVQSNTRRWARGYTGGRAAAGRFNAMTGNSALARTSYPGPVRCTPSSARSRVVSPSSALPYGA